MDTILSIDADIKKGIKTKSLEMKKPEVSDSEKDGVNIVTPSAVIYKLRDINSELVRAWEEAFKDREYVHVSDRSLLFSLP